MSNGYWLEWLLAVYVPGRMIELFSGEDIARLRRAGRVARATLEAVAARIKPGLTTKAIDDWVREDTRQRGGRPAQLGYKGFPAAVCTSKNDVVCHGIPRADVCLSPGDILNVDVTTELDGFFGDTSRTLFVGEPTPEARHLVVTAEACLLAGISVIRHGARMGDIGASIEEVAHAAGYSVVRDYCGHGIGRRMHAEPSVPHVGVRGRGLRLRAGMVLTVEPMINAGDEDTFVEADGWTVRTVDGGLSAQFEHTILVCHGGYEILTQA